MHISGESQVWPANTGVDRLRSPPIVLPNPHASPPGLRVPGLCSTDGWSVRRDENINFTCLGWALAGFYRKLGLGFSVPMEEVNLLLPIFRLIERERWRQNYWWKCSREPGGGWSTQRSFVHGLLPVCAVAGFRGKWIKLIFFTAALRRRQWCAIRSLCFWVWGHTG